MTARPNIRGVVSADVVACENVLDGGAAIIRLEEVLLYFIGSEARISLSSLNHSIINYHHGYVS